MPRYLFMMKFTGTQMISDSIGATYNDIPTIEMYNKEALFRGMPLTYSTRYILIRATFHFLLSLPFWNTHLRFQKNDQKRRVKMR